MKVIALLVLIVVGINADCYLQYPRGSNDRLNEANADRNNANRLFDSQNNDRGGYASAPPMSYIVGSKLPIEWTAQHGCGSPSVECNIVVQYMCTNPAKDPAGVALRDGSTTNTITDNANQFNQKTGNGDYQFGMHESYQSYQDCKNRERNKGLFTADQALQGNGAIYTRQNNAGTRNGFECVEDRDYYPYWSPTQWKDIMVFAPNEQLCDYFKTESQNVKAKYSCVVTNPQAGKVPISEAACTAASGQWVATPAWGIAAPDCQIAQYSRDNHLGNVAGDGSTAGFNWTIPAEGCATAGTCDCAIRVRYNISTANTNNWGATADDSTKNGAKNSPVTNNPNTVVADTELTMALNTAQYGRTFQDRSYMFHIIPRPADIPAETPIFNLGVRGKRGNIVQTYPATEYDFVPNNLRIKEGDYVHFQWTGSDTNPNNNAGEGTAGTDRSNIVQVPDPNNNIPINDTQHADGTVTPLFDDDTTRANMALVGQTNCPTIAQLLKKNGNNQNAVNADPTNCAKLNAAPQYFDGGAQRINKTGTFYYMSTRNNNFSNRTQKGTLIVDPLGELSGGAVAGIVIGCVVGATVLAAAAVFTYGKMRPHSKIGQLVDKIPVPKFGRGSSSSSYSSYSVNNDRQKPLLG